MTTIRKAACAALLCLTAGTASGQTTQPTAEAERDLMLCLAAIQPLFDDKISDAMSIARVLSRCSQVSRYLADVNTFRQCVTDEANRTIERFNCKARREVFCP